MITKEKIFFIAISILFLISLGINLLRFVPETQNYKAYEKGLAQYGNNKYSDAYYSFGKVSRFSKIKSAATFRQALCAEKLEDTKTELKKYNEVIKLYPNSPLAIRSKYLKAQDEFDEQKYKKAQKEFKNILRAYPQSDYAIAAKYFLGAIEAENASSELFKFKKIESQKQSIKYFREYLAKAPTGKFATKAVQKWIATGAKVSSEDNLLFAKIYQENDDYISAAKHLKATNINLSWPYFVKDAYKNKKYDKVNYYTVLGLKGDGKGNVSINNSIDEKAYAQDVYKAIDMYLKLSKSPITSISYLVSISRTSDGQDYLLYKDCTNMPVAAQNACFNTLYYKYPNGQFAAEALANIFYDKVKNHKYFMAKKIGRAHLAKFKNSKSAPKIMFWLGKVSEFSKNYEEARGYYRSVIQQYPDDYYAYRSFLSLNRFRYYNTPELNVKEVAFPYENYNTSLITELVKLNDYGLINQLYKDDDFIQSWLYYQQGNFSASATLAREAMEKLPTKPNRLDLRWRLVYPIHYYDLIKHYAKPLHNDPALILSIIREESYFNPEAQSRVGARGLMQLMPATAAEAASRNGLSLPNVRFLFQPDMNIKLGNIYYSSLKRNLYSKDILAVLAYNGGLGSVSKWQNQLNYTDADDFIEQIPYSETQNYVKKVYRSYWNYIRIYDGISIK